MLAVEVIDRPDAAVVALEPIRARLLAALRTPGSASTLAGRFGLPRQQVNYHLRILEAHGLVRFVEERPRRGLTERMLVASAAGYVISPAALGEAAPDPVCNADRLSASYLVALAARVVREVGGLMRLASNAGRRLPTLAIDTDIRFRSATERAAFTTELATAITDLVSRYHAGDAPDGRAYRLLVAAHPLPRPVNSQPESEEPT